MSATAATCWASTASAHPRRAARCWVAMVSPSTTAARVCENCSGSRTPDVTRVQVRRQRHVESRSRPRQRQDNESAREGLRLARLHPALQRGRSPIRDQERQDRPRRRAQGRGVEEVEGLTAALPCRSGGSRELFAPSPAKAGEGWGGVLSGSRRTVATPSQPPPAVAGGGAKAKARGFRRSYQYPITAPSQSHDRRTRCPSPTPPCWRKTG